MEYPSTVAVVIGGQSTAVMKFFDEMIKADMLDDFGLLDKLQLVRIQDDFVALGKYFECIPWSNLLRSSWNDLKEACDTELGYVFYRLEHANNYMEYDSNAMAPYFDRRLLDLYQFNLKEVHPKLK